MDKREKVIKAFEFCLMSPSKEEIENDICSHEDCPYYREYNGGKCISAAASDALALLKAQEPVYPSWYEWLSGMGIVPIELTPDQAFLVADIGLLKKIPSETAQRLGIEPKEGSMSEFDMAIKYLREQYERAERIDWIHNPLAWALYQTWLHVHEPPKEG